MHIANCCAIPFGLTSDKFMSQHGSVPFNSKIAGVFFRAGYIESWGRGIQKICEACESLDAEKPKYNISGADIMVMFKALQSAIIPDSKWSNGGINGGLANKIIDNIRLNGFVTVTEISNIVGIPKRTVEREMKNLRESGCIVRKGSNRNGHWEVYE